jgi:hypothetical protein
MDLAALDDEVTGLAKFFATLLEIPCDWRKQPRAMHCAPSALLDLVTSGPIGVDELVSADAPGPATTETVYGLREMTVQVTVWSLSQKLGASARFFLERLRTRLRWTSSVTALAMLGLALVGVEPIVLADAPQDGRTASQASMDLHFTFGVAESDAPTPFIESVDLARSIDGAPPSTEKIP